MTMAESLQFGKQLTYLSRIGDLYDCWSTLTNAWCQKHGWFFFHCTVFNNVFVRQRAKNADKTQPGICLDSIDMPDMPNYFCLVNSECRSVKTIFCSKYEMTSFIWPLLYTRPEKVCAAQLSLLAGSFLKKEIPFWLPLKMMIRWYTT